MYSFPLDVFDMTAPHLYGKNALLSARLVSFKTADGQQCLEQKVASEGSAGGSLSQVTCA